MPPVYWLAVGFVAGVFVLGAAVQVPSVVCRAAYHAPDDQTITWKDGACVRVTVQPLETPK
jgi:hypothetical protein